jgi:alanyl-tRNA synthetase
VIADHLRALAFAIADGATPGNEGRGYVLRRILRRASRFSQNLNQKEPFIYKILPTLVQVMGDDFPELKERQDYISQVIFAEEERFMRTLRDGLARFEKIVQDLRTKGEKTVSGHDAFTLYDTYGFPLDLTGVLAEEAGLAVDQAGFAAAMAEQRERARSSAKFDAGLTSDEGWVILSPGKETEFVGYSTLESPVNVTRFKEVGDDVYVCLNRSPFYAESGGQVGDIGILANQHVSLKVNDTFKVLDMQVHKCSLTSGLLKKDTLTNLVGTVSAQERKATVRNHSATHLLQAALKTVLGPHVQQQGSRVTPDGLRFDFTHPKGLSPSEIEQIEGLVNREILENQTVAVKEMPITQAKSEGATALFGEKYGDTVRTVKMGSFSYELCGGTHATSTGQIGLFRITSESSIASGVRRIEAVTGLGALALSKKEAATLDSVSRLLKATPDEVFQRVQEQSDKLKALDKELKALRSEKLTVAIYRLISEAKVINGLKTVVTKLEGEHFNKVMHQQLLDSLAEKLGKGVAILTQVEDGTLSLLAAVGPDARAQYKAGDIIKSLCTVANARGGGRPDKAQAGSKNPEREADVLVAAATLLSKGL